MRKCPPYGANAKCRFDTTKTTGYLGSMRFAEKGCQGGVLAGVNTVRPGERLLVCWVWFVSRSVFR